MAMIKARGKKQGNTRLAAAEPAGLWHQPAFMNLLADLLIVLATAALGWAAMTALQRLPLFPLRELVLTGVPRHVSTAQLEHASRNAIAGNFFTVDLEATRTAFEKLPWVRKATISRQWPDGLKLTLEEHEARARWLPLTQREHSPSQPMLVNLQGELFLAEADPATRRLPLLSGPDDTAPELLKRHETFSAALVETGRRIDRLNLSSRRAWRIELDNALAIELGRDQEKHPLAERLARFVTHYDFIAAQTANGRSIDMRYPNGFVMGRAQERKS